MGGELVKVLISGGAGYIGSVLTEQLLEKGHEVVIYDNLLYRQDSIAYMCHNPRLTFIHGDVKDHASLHKQIQKSDVIIPLAAIVGAPACDKDKQLATNVNYTHVAYISQNTSKSQRIILPNTNSGYGVNENGICTEESPLNPISHYGMTKVQAETCLLSAGNGISLRLATVFGISPRMRIDLLVNDFTHKAIHDGYIVLFEKNFKRNYIHIRDVVSAFMFMLDHYDEANGQVFNVGLSNANISKWELCQKIKEQIPNFSIQVDEFTKDPDQRDYIVSNEKIEKMGWEPVFSLDDGIRELIEGYKILIHSNRKYTNL